MALSSESVRRDTEAAGTARADAQDAADLAVGEAIAFDQLAVGGPLLLELRKRRGVHHCAAWLELMDMNVYQVRCLTSPRENRPADRASTGTPDDRGLDAQIGSMWPFWQGCSISLSV